MDAFLAGPGPADRSITRMPSQQWERGKASGYRLQNKTQIVAR